MSTTTVPPEVEAYLASVREALDDLPSAERDDLLAEVEDSLVEAAADGPIAARLGRPEDFAAELRAAAGLHARPAEQRPGASSRWRELAAGIAAHPRIRSLWHLAGELAPAWWLVRGYLAVAALALLLDASWSVNHPWMPLLLGSAWGGVLVIAAAVAVSMWAGLRLRGAHGAAARTAIAANVLLVLALVPVVQHLREPRPERVLYVTEAAAPLPGLASSGSSVLNIYPFSRDGQLLHDVLLYDQFGDPIEIGHNGVADPNRRFLRTAIGAALFNSFPIRYYEPGTTRVARPNAGPSIRVPSIETPPLPAP